MTMKRLTDDQRAALVPFQDRLAAWGYSLQAATVGNLSSSLMGYLIDGAGGEPFTVDLPESRDHELEELTTKLLLEQEEPRPARPRQNPGPVSPPPFTKTTNLTALRPGKAHFSNLPRGHGSMSTAMANPKRIKGLRRNKKIQKGRPGPS